jgi:hypothetical protein
VAVTNDFKTFRLTGFEEHNEFSKMADFLLGKTTPIEENILSLSVLSYFMETGLQDIKIVSNSREFKKLMKEWDIQDFEIDKFARKSIADQIKSPSIEKKGDAWEVTFFVLAYKRYVSVREVHINVNDRIFAIVKDEPIS